MSTPVEVEVEGEAIPIHPEPVAQDPFALRWVIPAGTLGCGIPVTIPEPLSALFDERVLTTALVEEGAVWLWLNPTYSWAEVGVRVRSALEQALHDPDAWDVREADDIVLLHVAAEVLAGSTGDVIRSHGGEAELTSVKDNVVAVYLSGACSSCPAIGFTLRHRIESDIRRRHSALKSVDSA